MPPQQTPESPFTPRPQTPHYVDRSAPHPQPAPQPVMQTPIYGDQPGAPQAHEYSFIMNPTKAPAHRGLPGNGSKPVKIAYGLGGLVLLLIVLIIGKNLLSSGGNFTQFIGVAADQQELIHLATNATAGQQSSQLSDATQNYIYTTQLGITSAQSNLIAYLTSNHQKVGKKQLASKISATTDSQLTAAIADSTYEQTLHDVMKTKLTDYRSDLSAAYTTTKGAKGKTLLQKQYTEAGLLLKQLDTK